MEAKSREYCKNCNSETTNNYCGACGQSAKTSRIDRHYLLHEIQHSILHVDKGILYTVKELIIRPGHMIEVYLDGKRVNYFKPFGFVLILATIYSFLFHFFHVYPGEELFSSNDTTQINYGQNVFYWIHDHYSLFFSISIPVFALSSFLVFRKRGYNYIEHIVIYSYIMGFRIFMAILLYPLFYIFPSKQTFSIIIILSFAYNIWVLTQLFKTKYWISAFIKALLSMLLVILAMMVTSIVIFLIILS